MPVKNNKTKKALVVPEPGEGTGMTVLLVGHQPLIKEFLLQEGFMLSKGIDYYDYDMVMFGGGPDVSPFMYGQKTLPITFFNMDLDFHENAVYRSIPDNVPKVGICRGAQFLCVMNGGSLWQDVSNHTKSHDIIDCETQAIVKDVSSTHHQMMDLSFHWETAHLIAYSKIASKKTDNIKTYRRDAESAWVEPEVVWYPATASLCVQFHPEYRPKDSACRNYFFKVLEDTVVHHLNTLRGKVA